MPMVRFTLKTSCREASCCSLLVVNGAVALRRRSLRATARTHFFSDLLFGQSGGVDGFDRSFLAVDAHEASREGKAFGLRQQVGIDGPVLDRIECLDLAFAFDDEAQSDGLHATGGEAAAH